MKISPFFSIIIPTYNREAMIGIAIKSVLNQTFTNWELIIVDDGSTDNTKTVVESFKDERIKYIWQQNQERSVARNNGIKQCLGVYICFLDSDDYYLENHLELFNAFIEKSEDKNGMFYIKNLSDESERFNVYEKLLKNIIHSQEVCIHQSVFDKELFDPKIHIGEDLDLWMRIAINFPTVNIPGSTVTIVDHQDRSVNFLETNSFSEGIKVFHKVFGDPRWKYEISKYVKKTILSDCNFGIAKFHIYQNNNRNAIIYITKSIICYPSRQFKHKIVTLLSINNSISQLLNIKNEYKKSTP